MRVSPVLVAPLLISALLMSSVPTPGVYKPAPDFTLVDIEGETFSLSDYHGRVVLLDFFATWCKPCILEIPHLREVYHAYGGEIAIISISVDPDHDTVQLLREFRDEHGILWRVARDTSGVSEEYGIQYIPTLFIIDQNGYIRYQHVGVTESSTLMDEIDSLLGVTPSPQAPFDFSLAASPDRREVAQGGSVGYTINVCLRNGTPEEVSLSLLGLPEGASYKFKPESGLPPFPSILTISVGEETPVGTYTITVVGVSGELSRNTTITLEVKKRRGCIIATATYGSELAPEVQLLRDFRDGVVYSTFAGACFMRVFNAWYYSFSPPIADLIARNPPLRAATRLFLYPLICVLRVSIPVYRLLSFSPEVGVVAAGVLASALLGAVYLTPLLTPLLLWLRSRNIHVKAPRRLLPAASLAALGLLAVGDAAAWPWLVAPASAALVVFTSLASAFVVSSLMVRWLPWVKSKF